MADGTEPPAGAYCTKPPTGQLLTDACTQCGHAVVLHVGCEYCPACELQHILAYARSVTGVDRQGRTPAQRELERLGEAHPFRR